MKQLSLVKKVLVYIMYIILIPIIVYDIILILQNTLNPGVTPNLFGIKTFQIVSGSMEPKINIDDIVIIKNVSEQEIKKGDIITFKIEGETVTHRVLNIENTNNKLIYTTKGDKNEVTDIEKIEFNQIEGKFITKIPKIGAIISLLQNKLVFTALIIILGICYYEQRNTMNRKIQRKEKRIKFNNIKREAI